MPHLYSCFPLPFVNLKTLSANSHCLIKRSSSLCRVKVLIRKYPLHGGFEIFTRISSETRLLIVENSIPNCTILMSILYLIFSSVFSSLN